MLVPEADPPVSVSIIPRGPAGGVTWMAPGDDLFLTRRRAFARLIVAMSGRAAEEILLDGEFTSGPHGDLQAATDMALAMVTRYGMTDMGLMTKSEGILSVGGKAMDESIDAVEHLLSEALKVARQVLHDNSETLRLVAEALLENDTLGYADLEVIRTKAEDDRDGEKPDFPHSGFQKPRQSEGGTSVSKDSRGLVYSAETDKRVTLSGPPTLMNTIRRWLRRAANGGA